jgi:hypothetical protein
MPSCSIAGLATHSMSQISPNFDHFWHWLMENYGFDAEMRPLNHRPPKFVRADGYFDVTAYERWLKEKRKEWAQILTSS